MTYADVVRFVQQHFADGLVLVIGSGLSSAEGIPGMAQLAAHLSSSADKLPLGREAWWGSVKCALDAGEGLEAALLKHPPYEQQERWIAAETARCLLPLERIAISAVLQGTHELKLTTLLRALLKPAKAGIPIVTTNYDRLVEVACEMAGLHVDTTALGLYAGAFDPVRSCMGSCRGIVSRGKVTELDHYPRAVVLKPHGSFDWFSTPLGPRRCSLDLDAERLIITPGLNKFRAGYNAPFDKHRELANEHIKRSARLLAVGYGFNDDHLQTHLTKRIQDGTPTLVLTRTPTPLISQLAEQSPACVCLSRPAYGDGVAILSRNTKLDQPGKNLWELDTLAREMLL